MNQSPSQVVSPDHWERALLRHIRFSFLDDFCRRLVLGHIKWYFLIPLDGAGDRVQRVLSWTEICPWISGPGARVGHSR